MSNRNRKSLWNLLAGPSKASRRRSHPFGARRHRSGFEQLEDRRVLATLWVDPYVISIGNPLPGVFATINDAVAAAKNGDTIKVMPGTYQNASDVDVTKSVTIIGAQVRVSGETTDSESTIEGNPNSETALELNANNITIKNFYIENEDTGIVISTDALVSGFHIVNNRFYHNLNSIQLATTLSTSAKASTISQNHFIATNGSPFREEAIDLFVGARNVTISNNEFSGTYSDSAIAVNETEPSAIFRSVNVQILNNSFGAGDGIIVANATQVKVAGNDFLNVNDIGVKISGGVTNSQITANTLSGTGSSLDTAIDFDENSDAMPNTGDSVSNNFISNFYVGVNFDAGNDQNTISGNTISDSGLGIYILSNKNTISSNAVERSGYDSLSNAGYGILIYASSNNTVTKNAVHGSQRSGLFLDGSTATTVSSNNLSGNLDAGLVATGATGNTISGNVANQNASFGFALEAASFGNTLSGNTTNFNDDSGVFLEQASDSNTIKGNTANNNHHYGFYIDGSESNHFTSNKASVNEENGFELTDAAENFFTSNASNGNFGAGFDVTSSSNENLFSKNTAGNNFDEGIFVESNDNSLNGNTVNNNGATGISIVDAVGVILIGNTVDNNGGGADGGIGLSDTSEGTISGNTVKNNFGDGIFVASGSANNTISGNTATGNGANSYTVAFDLHDDSTGPGTDGTANTWHNNKAGTSNPIGLLTA
jgi:parallel beta-helix repeat protein